MARKFAELRAQMRPDAQQRSKSRANQMLADINLAELRQSIGMSQREVAVVMNVNQPAIAKIEQRTDMLLSTLKHYVSAIGGAMRITIDIPGERTKPFEIHQPNANFDLVMRENVEEIFADSVSSLSLGYPVSKLLFHSVIPPLDTANPTGVELLREGTVSVVIPTSVLIGLAIDTIKSISTVKEQFSDDMNRNIALLTALLNSLPQPGDASSEV